MKKKLKKFLSYEFKLTPKSTKIALTKQLKWQMKLMLFDARQCNLSNDHGFFSTSTPHFLTIRKRSYAFL